MSWRQYAAANRDGVMPSLYEYLENALDLFDRGQYANDDEAKAMVDVIIKTQGASITELLKGKHYHPKYGDIMPKYDTTLDVVVGNEDGVEITVGSRIAMTEQGYGEVEDSEEMRVRLRMVASRLRPDDMVTLLSYVNGEYDTLTEACGGKQAYKTFTRRMKVATRGLKEAMA